MPPDLLKEFQGQKWVMLILLVLEQKQTADLYALLQRMMAYNEFDTLQFVYWLASKANVT